MVGQIWLLGCYLLAPALKKQSVLVHFLSLKLETAEWFMKNSACNFKDLEVQGGESNNIPLAGGVSRTPQWVRTSHRKMEQPDPGLDRVSHTPGWS